MNKKQLTLQNSSLFAELERKAKELEILNIRLDEFEQKSKAFADEIEALKESLQKAEAENKALIQKNNELEAELAVAKSKVLPTTGLTEFLNLPVKEEVFNQKSEDTTSENSPESVAFTENESLPTEENQINIETEILNSGESAANTTLEEDTVCKAASTEPQPFVVPAFEESAKSDISEAEIPPSPTFAENTREKTEVSPSIDLLRDYAARIIGKVTRITAEVLSKVSAVNDDVGESLKTLALGKNESFKFRIMELAKQKDDPEKAMAEMDLLADEAIVYLRSI